MQFGTGLGTQQLRIEKLLLSNCFYYHIIAGITHTSSARLAKAQILQQAGTAMLSQAHAQSQTVLSLVKQLV